MSEIFEQFLASYIVGIISKFPRIAYIFLAIFSVSLLAMFWVLPCEAGIAIKEGIVWWRWLISIPAYIFGMLTVDLIRFIVSKFRRNKE